MASRRILLVDDDVNARSALRVLLDDEGYEIREAKDGEEALAQLLDFAPAVVLCDVRDYLVKPLALDALLAFLQKALEKRPREGGAATSLGERVHERFRLNGIVGDAPELQAIFEVVKNAAPTRATVLILGESGTGKELVAQALHEESSRSDKPFIKVTCSALSETLLESELFGHERGQSIGAIGRKKGRFELADSGTIFLDEIGKIPPSTQAKLLRVLQQHEFERVGGTETLKVDVRVVAATNLDLAAEVKMGHFRDELLRRLNVVTVIMPPLRRLKRDIPAMVSHFMEKYAKIYDKTVDTLGPGTLEALLAHDWPGNVRELENAVERAIVLCANGELTLGDLPQSVRNPQALAPSIRAPGTTLRDVERDAILSTLAIVDGSTIRAAEILGISVRKVQYRLKEYRVLERLAEKQEPGPLGHQAPSA